MAKIAENKEKSFNYCKNSCYIFMQIYGKIVIYDLNVNKVRIHDIIKSRIKQKKNKFIFKPNYLLDEWKKKKESELHLPSTMIASSVSYVFVVTSSMLNALSKCSSR